MDSESDNFITPKRTKRLGLGRSSANILKNGSAKKEAEPVAKSKETENATPVLRLGMKMLRSDGKIKFKQVEENINVPLGTPKNKYHETLLSTFKGRLLQSDGKISYKQIKQNDNVSTPCTPQKTCSETSVSKFKKRLIRSEQTEQNSNETDSGTPKKICLTETHQSLIGNSVVRPYRLALSRRVRERITKKRLEFHLATEIEKEDINQQHSQVETQNAVTDKDISSRKELLHLIEISSKELASRQEHVNKVQELQNIIDVWKVGFASALHDLQQQIKPSLEKEAILERLHIPQEMIKHLRD